MKTSSGFEFRIDDAARNDMEFLETLIAMKEDERSRAVYCPKLIRILLGEDQKKALYEHCRDSETGRVPITSVMSEFEEILLSLDEAKKK